MIFIINVREINLILRFLKISQTQGRPNAHFPLSFSRKPRPEAPLAAAAGVSLVYLCLMLVDNPTHPPHPPTGHCRADISRHVLGCSPPKSLCCLSPLVRDQRGVRGQDLGAPHRVLPVHWGWGGLAPRGQQEYGSSSLLSNIPHPYYYLIHIPYPPHLYFFLSSSLDFSA